MEKKQKAGRIWERNLYTVLHDFIYILTAITIVFVFFIRIVGVSGPSMQPTLQNGECVVLRSSFLSDKYEPGDIVVATVPSYDASRPIVKRVIAVEGQTVDIDFTTGEVRVDQKLLEEPYLEEPTAANFDDGLEYPVKVPEGCVFLMGDNRNNSTDSRYAPIGCVDTDDILGEVLLRVYPINRIGGIK